MSTFADWDDQRRQMVEQQLVRRGIRDERVLAAMRKVPRHIYCESNPGAYDDRPLDIGQRQTISQPFMVALMTERLHLLGTERVLEIGTGSGYQTAILAELAREVLSIERFPTLAQRAQQTLRAQGYTNIDILVGDGTLGWPERAPYDRIIVTAGAPNVPPMLRTQLADGGTLVIPVGDHVMQMLTIVTRNGDNFDEKADTPCTFVRLVGRDGWQQSD